jgi:chondroitin 4-sulfotransferase 11
MPVSHQHRTIFVHIPKTAGTSVEAVLGMHGRRQDVGIVPYFKQELDYEHLYGRQLQHLSAQEIRTHLNDDALFSGYFKFTIVRNPWDRLVSSMAWTDQKWAKGVALTGDEFAQQLRQIQDALAAIAAGAAGVTLPHYLRPQTHYVLDSSGRPLVDFIARYENLANDWRVIARRLGPAVAAQLPLRMRSHHQHYRRYYSAETRALVGELYADEVRLLEYEF